MQEIVKWKKKKQNTPPQKKTNKTKQKTTNKQKKTPRIWQLKLRTVELKV